MRPGCGLLPAHSDPLRAVLPELLHKGLLEGLCCFHRVHWPGALCDCSDPTCRSRKDALQCQYIMWPPASKGMIMKTIPKCHVLMHPPFVFCIEPQYENISCSATLDTTCDLSYGFETRVAPRVIGGIVTSHMRQHTRRSNVSGGSPLKLDAVICAAILSRRRTPDPVVPRSWQKLASQVCCCRCAEPYGPKQQPEAAADGYNGEVHQRA